VRGGRFRDRVEAGGTLAALLSEYRDRDVVVLALPRGGVPVAAQVARALDAPLDVFVVRKLGVPGHEELAMGAIASGGIVVVDDALARRAGAGPDDVAAVIERETAELERREIAYRAGRPPADVRGKTVIVVDDGLATGSTMRAAVEALRRMEPDLIVVAVPTAPLAVCQELASRGAEVVSAINPPDFEAVGQWYDDFTQTSDDDVRAVLESVRRAPRRE
jgi:putative phosphoribosyl transferase